MLCKEIMKHNVECISPEESTEFAAQKMRDQNVGFLPICDETMKVLGTITDRDIAIRLVAENLPATTPVEEVMTPDVVACKSTDDVRKVEQLMGKHQKSRIMCLDDAGHLVGVISLSDIAQHERGARAAQTMRQVTEREAHP
jgi:CBS domain-containing protein